MTKALLAFVIGLLAGLSLRRSGPPCEPGIQVVSDHASVVVSASCPVLDADSTEAFSFGLSVERSGPSGIATSRQSGRLAAIASEQASGPRVQLSAVPGDTLRISLTIARGDLIIASTESTHVIGQRPLERTSL
ncbi:MAG TPA: curli-like amyloid fiber formation chaperone CsgH [Rhodothermales bacterium]